MTVDVGICASFMNFISPFELVALQVEPAGLLSHLGCEAPAPGLLAAVARRPRRGEPPRGGRRTEVCVASPAEGWRGSDRARPVPATRPAPMPDGVPAADMPRSESATGARNRWVGAFEGRAQAANSGRYLCFCTM